MGTRNLTMVISNGRPVVAQYGQWDGYPSGQGATALLFLLGSDMNKFKKNIMRCRFIDNNPAKQSEIQKFLKELGCENGYMNMEQSAKYREKYPYLTRDHGAQILELIYQDKSRNAIWLYDSSDFASDSLFCEWAYVIDLDKETFEVYEGFVETPLVEGERFYQLQVENKHYVERREEQYYPVRHVKTYKLSELPKDVDSFVKEINALTEEKEEA